MGERAGNTRLAEVVAALHDLTPYRTGVDERRPVAVSEIAATLYYLDPPTHERSSGWPATRISLAAGYYFYPGRRTVKATGSFGWSAVPAAIRAIAEMMCVSAYRARGSGGTSTFTVGIDGERSYQRMLTTSDLKTLAWYREPFA